MNEGILLAETVSVCPDCLVRLPAVLVQEGENVFMRKECPDHGRYQTIVWRGVVSYRSWNRLKRPAYPRHPSTEAKKGCPRDCGLCPEHRQQTCTALIEVTQRCNLRCSFCFADSGRGDSQEPDMGSIRDSLEHLLGASGAVNIQLSGGEPTLREDLPEIVRLARSMGFPFVQLNSNGLRLAADLRFLAALKEAGLDSVFLQFDGVTDDVHVKLRGAPLLHMKQRAVELCAEHEIGVTLVPTLVPGINTHQIGAMIDFALERLPGVRGVHFQPVSYFGRYPCSPSDEDRMTIPEIMAAIEQQTGGRIRLESFKPPACENAYCSFHGNFILMPDGDLRPWSRHPLSNCSCKLEDAAEGAAKARAFVSRMWTFPKVENRVDACGLTLGGWEDLIGRVHTHSLCISGMAFQDCWNLDLNRLRDCCIHVLQPGGKIIPFCAFNLTDREGEAIYRPGLSGIGGRKKVCEGGEGRVSPC